MQNQSVPTNAAIPHIIYANVAEAIAFLTTNFGFTEHYRYGPPTDPQGAQLRLHQAVIMLTSTRAGRSTPNQLSAITQYTTIIVPDAHAHHAHAKSAGATITEPPTQTPYGELEYSAQDHAGHRWIFSQHTANVPPQDWGATPAP